MASALEMAVHRPRGRLGLYVRSFQVFSRAPRQPVSVLDFGGGDVSVPFRFGDPVVVKHREDAEVQSAILVGPKRQAVWLRFAGNIDQVNVSFFPGAASAFMDVPMPELVGRVASPDDVWPRVFREAAADLEPLPTAERIGRLTDLLLATMEPRREPGPQIREAIRLIRAHGGRVSVRWLAEEVNLSISQLERTFTRHVGFGPKLLARHARLSALAADAMRPARPDWAMLAVRHGYADQAHLAREFRDLTGLTPSGFAGMGPDAEFLQDAVACREPWAFASARASVEAWAPEAYDTARSMIAPDVVNGN